MSERRFSRRVAIQGRLSKPAARNAPRGRAPQLRRASERDLAALVELEQSAFTGDRLSLRQFRRHLASPSADLLVAVGAAGIDGYALLFRRRGSRVGRIYSIAVAAAARGKGLGDRLLRRLEATARVHGLTEIRLEVRQDNAAAAALYARRGYLRFGERKEYYEDGGDAWRMAKSLLPRRRRRDRLAR
jgi:ribosomal-protein-alanine acetyltransferase